MKVAVCLFGQPRNAVASYSYIYNNIILPNNADVFIHMHYDPDNLCIEKSHARECRLEPGLDRRLIDLYHPVKYLVEPPRHFHNKHIILDEKRLQRSFDMNSDKPWTKEEHSDHTLRQITSMFYSIYKSNELKELYALENGITYDYVIRLRFDLKVHEPIICANYEPHKLYYIEIGQPDQMICDWLNFGSNAIMNVVASTFLYMEYMNTFRFYKLEDRISREPSEQCGGLCEHIIRDMVHVHQIPRQGIHLRCEL